MFHVCAHGDELAFGTDHHVNKVTFSSAFRPPPISIAAAASLTTTTTGSTIVDTTSTAYGNNNNNHRHETGSMSDGKLPQHAPHVWNL
jgi:hypothetical protein